MHVPPVLGDFAIRTAFNRVEFLLSCLEVEFLE